MLVSSSFFSSGFFCFFWVRRGDRENQLFTWKGCSRFRYSSVVYPGLLCQHYPRPSSHHCTAPFPEHFPGNFSGSYWQNSPVQTMLSRDPRYKTQFLVMYSQPPHWFKSRPRQGYSSNPSGTAVVTDVLGASSIIFLVLAQTVTISQSWFYRRSCLNIIVVIGQEQLMSSDLSQKELWSAHHYVGPGTETRSSKYYTCCSVM